jgi:L-threonylcarbamoyladenylate synthase
MVDFANDIKACVAALEAGGSILYPTDTIWGLGCDATDEAAVARLYELKRRPLHKSLIVFLPEARDILRFVAAPPPDIIAIVEAFGRPTTVIFDGALGLAENAISEDGSVGIRVPQDPFCKALLKRFGKPIISTSANFSGESTASAFHEVNPQLVTAVDYVVKYRQGDNVPKQPSRIVRVSDEGEMQILRA